MSNLLPSDFNGDEYLNLNPDVKKTGVTPEIHYLNFGIKEDRKYKVKKLVIGMGLIVKDEAPYILEWIAHHMLLGIDKFIIADNSSTDGTKEILTKLSQAGIVNLIHYPGLSGEPPQMLAYSEILRNSIGIDWMAFIDADEFIVTSPGVSLISVITDLSKNNKIGAIAINWSIYGSSNHIYKNIGLVIERFKYRSEQSHPVNKHYKSLLRLNSVSKCPIFNPHNFELKEGQNYVHPNGVIMMDSQKFGVGLSEQVIWEPFRLNHYVIKSKEEFLIRSKKPRATTIQKNHKNESYFNAHDRNEVFEDFEEGWVLKVNKKIDFLNSIILKDCKSQFIQKDNFRRLGFIDSIKLENNHIRIKGWSDLMSGSGQEHISLFYLDKPMEIISVLPIKRDDVANTVQGISSFCGFEITCNSKEVTHYELEEIKKIHVDVKAGDAVDTLNLNKKIAESTLTLTFPRLLREFYIKHALSSKLIVEYGSGSSTFFCAMNEIPIISVESDLTFLNYLKSEIDQFTLNHTHVKLLHANIGNTKSLGYPENDTFIRLFPQYATLPWKLSLSQDVEPDLVLIDGRFRSACMLTTMVNIRKPTKVIFDDYVDRNYHQIIEQFVKPLEIIDRAAYFEISPRELSALDILKHLESFFDPS